MKKIAIIFSAILLSVVILGLYACAKKDAVLPKYKMSGKITNTTDRPVASANVSLTKDGESHPKYTDITTPNGEYDFGVVDEGKYKIKITRQGYKETTQSHYVDKDGSKDVLLYGKANVHGSVIDSQTGDGLANATVGFGRDPSQTTNDNAELLVNTDESGNFNIEEGPTGNFTGLIESEGYFTRRVDDVGFVEGNNNLDPQTIVQQPNEGEMRIILTWGQDPDDLDSHLSGPNSTGGRFHVYYSDQNYGEAVNLDVDDVDSFGPETITISSFIDGMYRYSIHNYSEQSTTGGEEIYNSPTLVEVYDYTSLIKSYTAPPFTGSGNTWRVFEINVTGTSYNIVDINTYVQASSSGDDDIFNIIDDKRDLIFYLDEL